MLAVVRVGVVSSGSWCLDFVASFWEGGAWVVMLMLREHDSIVSQAACQQAIVAADGVPLLLGVLATSSNLARQYSLEALAACVVSEIIRNAVVKADGVKAITAALSAAVAGSQEQRHAVVILNGIVTTAESAAAVLEFNGTPALAECLKLPVATAKDAVESAVALLTRICEVGGADKKGKIAVAGAGTIAPLVALLSLPVMSKSAVHCLRFESHGAML